MRLDDVAHLLAPQDGVVARQQLLRAGATSRDVERWVRRRDLSRVHPGVYVDHTGPPWWTQRAWAGTLLHAPAVLDAASALRAWGVRTGAGRDDDPIELLVRHGRRVGDPVGVHTRVSRAGVPARGAHRCGGRSHVSPGASLPARGGARARSPTR